MDPIELCKIRDKTSSIQFGLKYDQRRRSSAYSKRSSFFQSLSTLDRTNNVPQRTNSVTIEARQAELDVWQLIKCLMPVRKLRCSIRKHVVIDQSDPFVLFAIGLESDYSRFITKNTFENFEVLQKQLVSLDNQLVFSKAAAPHSAVQTHRLKDVLPRLPVPFLSLFWRKAVPSQADLVVSRIYSTDYLIVYTRIFYQSYLF